MAKISEMFEKRKKKIEYFASGNTIGWATDFIGGAKSFAKASGQSISPSSEFFYEET